MTDLAKGEYKVPWEDQVVHTDGASCGFAAPARVYGGPKDPPALPP